MDVVEIEQTKLLATGINNIAVAFVVIGVVTPVIAVGFGVANAPEWRLGSGALAVVWLCTGGLLHRLARRSLRSLGR
ncbi:hypothetical protein [uncultured Methylobacterium sp.]|uniref:hypothetical protein n=1 Tax=uncultured Methylobacterium sp. TaxID=157278 RepID=UPI0035CC5B8B